MATEYQAPTIAVLGAVSDLTLASGDGNFTDAAFPIKTPKKDVTFS